jgi:hypothetical protein
VRRRHSSAVEQLFRKSLTVCAVLQAWQPDTNGHTYQLFDSRGFRLGSPLGPVFLRADPKHPKSSHKLAVRSIVLHPNHASDEKEPQVQPGHLDSRRPRRASRVAIACRAREGRTADDSDARTLNRADNYPCRAPLRTKPTTVRSVGEFRRAGSERVRRLQPEQRSARVDEPLERARGGRPPATRRMVQPVTDPETFERFAKRRAPMRPRCR